MEPLPIDEALQIRSDLTKTFLATPEEFDLPALANRGWVAVPFPERINQPQALLIAGESKRRGLEHGIAVTTDPAAKVEAHRVGLTEQGILDFDANCMLRPFLLVSEEEEFALLEEGDYYYLLAGPVDFLIAATGGNLESAWKSFERYAASFEVSRPEREWLASLLDRYRKGSTSIGGLSGMSAEDP